MHTCGNILKTHSLFVYFAAISIQCSLIYVIDIITAWENTASLIVHTMIIIMKYQLTSRSSLIQERYIYCMVQITPYDSQLPIASGKPMQMYMMHVILKLCN